MKFSSREDIEAPPAEVFDRLTDYGAHERAVMRRGVRLQRIDGLQETGIGMTWAAQVKFRGKTRNISVELLEYQAQELLQYSMEGSGLSGIFVVDLLALSPRKTRMSVALEVRPKNLTGRMLMQSLRILKVTLNRRFKLRVADYARMLSGQSMDD